MWDSYNGFSSFHDLFRLLRLERFSNLGNSPPDINYKTKLYNYFGLYSLTSSLSVQPSKLTVSYPETDSRHKFTDGRNFIMVQHYTVYEKKAFDVMLHKPQYQAFNADLDLVRMADILLKTTGINHVNHNIPSCDDRYRFYEFNLSCQAQHHSNLLDAPSIAKPLARLDSINYLHNYQCPISLEGFYDYRESCQYEYLKNDWLRCPRFETKELFGFVPSFTEWSLSRVSLYVPITY